MSRLLAATGEVVRKGAEFLGLTVSKAARVTAAVRLPSQGVV